MSVDVVPRQVSFNGSWEGNGRLNQHHRNQGVDSARRYPHSVPTHRRWNWKSTGEDYQSRNYRGASGVGVLIPSGGDP